jgi:mono/diheme cytochrome c family protein
MRRTLLSAFLCGFVAAVSSPALGQAGDAHVGAELIKHNCASCHAIGADPEAKSPDPKAPRFLDVAEMPSTTELSIKVFLRSSHKNMPNFILSEEEIDGVAAYILKLKKK